MRDDRRLVLLLAQWEWERTRHIHRKRGQSPSEPPWEALSTELRNLWLKNIEDFVKQLRVWEAQSSSSGETNT